MPKEGEVVPMWKKFFEKEEPPFGKKVRQSKNFLFQVVI